MATGLSAGAIVTANVVGFKRTRGLKMKLAGVSQARLVVIASLILLGQDGDEAQR